MAPSSGHLLVPKAMRVVKFALSKTKTFLRDKVASSKTTTTSSNSALLHPNPLPLRTSLHQSRSFTTFRHRALPSKPTAKPARPSLPASRRAHTPFASPLRPHLTGGALPRSAGGYSLGGVRHFSHTPAAPAQVLQSVSAACRAFWLGGQKARFDGVDRRSGEKRYRCVQGMQDATRETEQAEWMGAGGARVEFKIAPTVTALAAGSTAAQTLGSEGVLEVLAGDFARAVGDLEAVMADLKRLARLGDLPVGVGDGRVCVSFPGCDRERVERLCEEAGVRRGVVRAGEEMALRFPFAPGGKTWSVDADEGVEDLDGSFHHKLRPDSVEWRHMISPYSSRATSELGTANQGFEDAESPSPCMASSPSGYSSLHDSDFADGDDLLVAAHDASGGGGAAGYDGLEGIYRFLSECEGARR